jgi:glutathione S-transferase
MIRLYGISQSRALRCLWALEEIGVPYEHVKIDFTTGAKQPEYLKINPNARIPSLVDGELVLFESMAINLYLSRKYGAGTLQPKSQDDDARAVQWSFWVMTEIEPPMMQIFLHTVAAPEAMRKPEIAKAGHDAIGKPLGVLDAALAGRETLLGGPFSIADLNVASVMGLLAVARYDFSRFPNLKRWFEASLARPAFARARAK